MSLCLILVSVSLSRGVVRERDKVPSLACSHFLLITAGHSVHAAVIAIIIIYIIIIIIITNER